MRFEDNSLSIGRTPLVRLNHVVGGSGATVWAKIEERMKNGYKALGGDVKPWSD